ncbi:DUF1802 family protein [Paenibacillus cremeus]|uniref:DUF1802 family protein n=1 Tax=Paenibacillus cremeus TaxID=2163881 RepID=A0A559KEB4_9BACL|nr:DUF1802 family protein [Paenibacillus cremeus]TVY10470.1 DUF1802 family protein [Paenibacillus cremeus]
MESGKEQAVALKEWAAAVEALRKGQQMLIMRKGGIREETKDFQVEADSFYLYPTYEHQKKQLIKPGFEQMVDEMIQGWSSEETETVIRCYAELEEDILISSQEELDKLRELHIWTDQFAEERLKWKKTKPLHVMLLRVYELEQPVRVRIMPEFIGCKSWIALPQEELSRMPRKQVMSDESFALAVEKVHKALNN